MTGRGPAGGGGMWPGRGCGGGEWACGPGRLTGSVSRRAAVARGLLQQVASEAEGTLRGPRLRPRAGPCSRGPGGGGRQGPLQGGAPRAPWKRTPRPHSPRPLPPAALLVRSVAAAQRSLGTRFWKSHRRVPPPPPPPAPAGASSPRPRPAGNVEYGAVCNAWTRLFPTERPGFVLQGPPHKCALIFADNSGIDVILGVFPFVRELLSRGTEVSVQAAAGPLPWALHSQWGWRRRGLRGR